jgi:PmbA protein
MEDLGNISDLVLSKASKEAASAECFSIHWQSTSVHVEDCRPNIAMVDEETGIGVKVALGKKLGFASATVEQGGDVTAAVETALRIARLSPEDPNYAGLPSGKEIKGSIEGLHDKTILDVTAEDLMDRAMVVVDTALQRKGMEVPKGFIRAQEYEFKISNSDGLDNGHKGTLLFLSFSSKITDGGKSGEGIEKVYSTKLKGIDFEHIGTKIADRALNTMDAKPFKGKLEAPTIIANAEIGQMLLSSFSYAVSGENVNKGRSPWADKLGTRLFSEQLTIQDRPHLPGAMQSALIDDEGSPTVDKTLVEKGVLKSFVNDHYNAGISNKDAGNGYRRGVGTIEKSFLGAVRSAVSNLTIPPGSKSLDDMIGELDRGIIVEKFAAPELNPYMGAFGLEVRNAGVIEKGELKEYVKFCLLSGNLYQSLGEIVSIGNDPAFGGPWMISDPGDAYCPSITFDGFTLVGQE